MSPLLKVFHLRIQHCVAKRLIPVILCCLFTSVSIRSTAASIVLHERDAVVWLEQQAVSGKTKDFFARQLIVQCNQSSFRVAVKKDSTFAVVLTLHKGENKIIVSTLSKTTKIASDTLTLTLGFAPTPLIRPYVIFKNQQLSLHAQVIKNPWKGSLHFSWSADAENPSASQLKNKDDSVAVVQVPSVNGLYFFNVAVYSLRDTARFRTYFVKSDSGVHVFDINSEHAPWIDTAVLYQVTPSNFVQNGTYEAITNKLNDIKNLGINTIWLQPVYSTFRGGQGYDIVDYFSLRKDFGTEQQLQNLIRKAKALHLRVLFDFVPNHTSIQHPYAQDCIQNGTASHYYNFYQHESDGAAYSSFYKKNKDGFITYFWEDLVNLNYNNEEVQRWMMEACKYWIKKFDIDGYRFDAVWGINARAPLFFQRLKLELKSIKPDLLLLAEDKASVQTPFRAGFDAAYDWMADTAWVSHWSWQYQYDARKNFTVFNHPDVAKRVDLLKKALFQNGEAANLRLHFIENNDLPRFVNSHSIEATKLAAGLVFSLPGIPLLYNGQEIGCKNHPYSKYAVFDSAKTIQAQDSNFLFPYYQKLISLRQKYPALQVGDITEASIQPDDKVVAFLRWKEDQTFLILLNLDSVSSTVHINESKIFSSKSLSENSSLEDVLSGSIFYNKKETEIEIEVPLEGYGIRWLLLKE